MGVSAELEMSDFFEFSFSLNLTERERFVAMLHPEGRTQEDGDMPS